MTARRGRRHVGAPVILLEALAVFVLTSWVRVDAATELQPDQTYAGGTEVESPGVGVSFVIPPGWVGRFGRTAQQEVLMLGSTTLEGVGLVILQLGQTPAQIVAELSRPQDLGGGVVLRPTGAPVAQGSRIMTRYRNELYVGRALALLGPTQSSVIIFFAGPTKNEEAYGRLQDGIEASTTFGAAAPAAAQAPAPAQPPAAAPPPAPAPGDVGPWSNLLAGQTLHYFSSYNSGGGGGGMAAHRVLHLCSDGRFAYGRDSLVTMNVPGATGASGGRDGFQGRWTLESPTQTTAVLVLAPEGGRELRWPIRYDGQKTFLNGQRWLREPSKACR